MKNNKSFMKLYFRIKFAVTPQKALELFNHILPYYTGTRMIRLPEKQSYWSPLRRHVKARYRKRVSRPDQRRYIEMLGFTKYIL